MVEERGFRKEEGELKQVWEGWAGIYHPLFALLPSIQTDLVSVCIHIIWTESH